MHGGAHVLGGEDLYGVIHGERGPHRVGSCRGLAPQRARDQVDSLRQSARLPIALHPQQMTGGVGDDQQVVGVASMRAKDLAQHRQGGLQTTLRAPLRERIRVELVGRATPGGLGLDACAP